MANSRVFATLSANSPMVKVWQIPRVGDYMRFQYVVHQEAVVDMFWQNSVDSDSHLTLFTVTRDFQMHSWRAYDDCDNLPACQSLRFALVATIDVAQRHISGSVNSDECRMPISVGIQYQRQPPTQTSQTLDSSSCSSDDNSNSKFSDPEPRGSSGNDPTIATSSTVEHQSTLEELCPRDIATASAANCFSSLNHIGSTSVYAVYNDGSMTVWRINQGPSAFLVAQVHASMNTVASKAIATLIAPTAFVKDSTYRPLSQSLMWNSSGHIQDGDLQNDRKLRLAVGDTVGHVFLFDVPLDTAETSADCTKVLNLHSLWDGHKESIFHISVDPYGQRVATHSIEGELLIWVQINIGDGRQQAISRKMTLDGSKIRTIAWAPVESEFIAATRKRVYRLLYNQETAEWSPCAMTLSELKPYDRIFTFPADSVNETLSTENTRTYYISTVDSSSRTVQTWRVSNQSESVEFIGNLTLSGPDSFDRVSRVMPVAHPFFSRDNIMATFDTSSCKLRIWGIRTDPSFIWFCSKEHRLPFMNVDMIRYNSIDKAAIVSSQEDGSQVVTIWVFSSASRASHYLPAGTIHPRGKADRVREIRWHLTEYAQTYLGIQWDDRIDIYCQERDLDDAWLCVYTIPAYEYGPDKKIGSFSFTASGEPTFSVDRKLVVCTQNITDGRSLSQAAYDEHGQLPLIHPYVLTELMSWGRVDIARRLLAQLYDYMREKEIDGSRNVPLPTVSLKDLVSEPIQDDEDQGRAFGPGSRYSALFGSSLLDETDNNNNLDVSSPDFGKFSQEKADYLLEKLAEIKISDISSIDQARLMSIVGTISTSLTKNQPIDSMGIRYLVKLQLLELENKRTRSSTELPYRELNWAMHSSSQAILLQLCLQQQQQQSPGSSAGLTWESARRMGLFVWLSDMSVLVTEVEKMARNIFVAEGRDPTKCAIFFLALRKQRLLHGLWRTASTHPECGKMLAFLAHNFSEPRWKTAAAKNAYVLLSRQRYLDAATFFLLSDKLLDAATICIKQLKDIQMAITICRCYEGDNGPVLKEILWKHILPDAFKRQDRWLASLAFGLIGKYDLVLQSLTDDLLRLAQKIEVTVEVSEYSTMDVLDTELLILYRSMINHSPFYRAPIVTQAELIAQTITIFECFGAPVMSLVVLEWWRRELYAITKRSLTSTKMSSSGLAKTMSTTDRASADTLDPSSMGIFASFAGFNKPSPAPTPVSAAADPLASGLLSMGGSGSLFSSFQSPKPKATTIGTQQQQRHVQQTSNPSTSKDSSDDSSLAVEIEDTPVQYACRVALALQIIEFIGRTSPRTFDLDIAKEKQVIADTLRLPLSIFV
ncbi:regulator of (H+)-ATPase in vacuolar membrane [Coemansia sp. RSA 2603]|nr:regulator of (H+)-ATPase in vacuolar membrane [Coemansia sp. RSA 2603]